MVTVELIHGASGHYGLDWGDNGRTKITSSYDRIYFLVAGHIIIRPEGGAEQRLLPGKLYLVTGGETGRYYRCSEDAQLYWVHSRLEVETGLSLFTHYDPPFAVEPEFDAKGILVRAITSADKNSPAATLAGIHCLTELYAPFLPDDWADIFPFSGKVEQLTPAVNVIHSRLNESVSLRGLAATVHLHPTYFSNLFKQVFGKSPLQYHLEHRMRWACGQLLSSGQTIAEVAYNCGYDDPLYFSRQFRKQVGVSPRDYRKRLGQLEP